MGEQEMAVLPPRPLGNPSGTSCHVTSALLFMQHCLHPIRNGLIDQVRRNKLRDDLCYRLACLWCIPPPDRNDDDPNWDADNNNTIHDALALVLNVLRSNPEIGIEDRLLGDAVTCVTKILQHLISQPTVTSNNITTTTTTTRPPTDNTGSNPLLTIWQAWIDAGRVYSILRGDSTKDENQPTTEPTKPFKITPSSRMSVPFSIPFTRSLSQSIQAVLSPRRIEGYQWPSTGDDVPEREWKTTKTLHIESIPPLWLVHVDRYKWQNGRSRSLRGSMEIPEQFHAHDIGLKNIDNYCYQLLGGIIHVDEWEDNDDQGNSEGGHYVTVVRLEDGKWYLIDDTSVVELTLPEALDRLSGCAVESDSETVFQSAILVAYQRQPTTVTDCHHPSLEICDGVDWARPERFIGKRLRVKWSQGKYYAGVVQCYDSETGQHDILYDDGDIRSYKLWKKTVEWE